VNISVTKFRPHWNPYQYIFRKWNTHSISTKLDFNSWWKNPADFSYGNGKSMGS
jgi:hypothetical protein